MMAFPRPSRSALTILAAAAMASSAACGDDGTSSSASSGTESTGPGAGGSTGQGGGSTTTNGTTGPGGGGASTSASSSGSNSTGTGEGGTAGEGGATGTGGTGQGGTGQGGTGQGGTGQGGTGQGGAGQGGGDPECVDAQGCPDPGTECILATCDAGTCGTTDVADGTPLLAQTDGDCATVVCDGNGGTRAEIDDADLPDDANPCTDDICDAGVPDFVPLAEGTSCGGSLLCDAAGNCVGCLTADDCPGNDTECSARICDAGTCDVGFTVAGTPLVAGQTAGDCQTLVCDGNGATTSQIDDADSPPDLIDCVIEECDTGVPSETPLGTGTDCDDNGGTLCDGAGTCVACLDDDDCGSSDTCVTRACVANACETTFAAPGTVVSDPIAGDCRRNECDGAGTILVDVAFDGDVPVDNLQCTGDVCTSGTPSNPNLPIDTACSQNNGTLCNGSGICVACTAGAQCPEGVCSAGVCAAAQCNDMVSNGNETGTDCGGPDCGPCGDGGGCELDADCQSGFCNPDLLLCATATCGDTYQNGLETDVDCGGGVCGDCGLGYACGSDADCLSSYCFEGYCSLNICGDGELGPGETCDDGDGIDGNGCDNNCQPSCGNSVIDAANNENCDDGDGQGGDGCSAACQIEANYQCSLASPNVCTRQEVLCTNGIDDDGDGQTDGADSDCPWNAQIPNCAAGETLRVYNSVRVPRALTDLSTITSEIFVPPTGTVRRVMIRFNITHTYDADLDISMLSPTGVLRDISSDNGGSGDNFTNTRIRQAAATAITAGSAPFNNEYRPEQTFNNYNGALATGFWRFQVYDDANGDTGTLNAYSLALCTN